MNELSQTSTPQAPQIDLARVLQSIECTEEVCITCSDEGRLGEVIEPPAGLFLPALVRTETGTEEVDVALVGDVVPGDLVLIHAGCAITRVPMPANVSEGVA